MASSNSSFGRRSPSADAWAGTVVLVLASLMSMAWIVGEDRAIYGDETAHIRILAVAFNQYSGPEVR